MALYITQSDLEAFIGPETVRAIFTDADTGDINTLAISMVLSIASSRVDGYLLRAYMFPLPPGGGIPGIVMECALLWAKALAYDRHPEYAQRYGRAPYEMAKEMSEQIANAELYLADQPNVPLTAGGLVPDINTNRMIVTGPDGIDNSGDWG